MEHRKSLGEKDKAASPRHRGDRARPAKQPDGRPAGPGERSDEESIGRPVQLDEPQAQHPPGESDDPGSQRLVRG